MARATGRGSDQFMLRLPDGMRDQIRTDAELNGRSMNAEIVSRLEESIKSADKLALALAELEETKAALKLTQHDADVASSVRDDLAYMTDTLRQWHDEDRAVIDEIRQLEIYLRSDAMCLQAELDRDPFTPSAVRPALSTELAQSLAGAVDTRTWLFTRTVRGLAQSASRHEASAVFAHTARHKISGDPITDQVLEAYLKEVVGLATELDAVDFYDALMSKVSSAPDEVREAFKEAADKLMPKLFAGWPDRWL